MALRELKDTQEPPKTTSCNFRSKLDPKTTFSPPKGKTKINPHVFLYGSSCLPPGILTVLQSLSIDQHGNFALTS